MRLVLPVALSALSIKALTVLAVTSTPDIIQSAGGWIAFLLAALAAGFERYNSKKITDRTSAEKQIVSEATAWKSSSELHERMSKDFRGLLETERTDHQKTRDYWHEKSNKFQSDLAKCNEDCIKLQGRTDISRVETLLLAQGQHMATIADGIRELLANSKS